MRKIIVALVFMFGLTSGLTLAGEGPEHGTKGIVSFKSDKDPMYYLGFSKDHPPTPAQAAAIAKRDGPEFAEHGIDPDYCGLWWSVDDRCFIGDAFKCWDQ